MKSIIRISMLAVLFTAVTVFSTAAVWPASAARTAAAEQPADRQSFREEMRKLWEDHITWTRLVIVSKLTQDEDLPDLAVTVDRLLRNQADIGDAIAPFYGAAAGAQLTHLLTGHIVIAADLLAAAKSGNAAAVSAALDAWYANGHDIAVFLNSANPGNWPLHEMDHMMREHLDLTLAEAVARLEQRYADEVATYDEIHRQILGMADMLSDGIIRQFPNRFSGAR
jgi:hypothetical protein